MHSRDLKIAAFLLLICFLISFGFAYSYAHGWTLTLGVMPLALIIILVLSATIVHEFAGSGRKVPAFSGRFDHHERVVRNGRGDAFPFLDFFALPIHGVVWLLLIATDKYVSTRLRELRSQHSEIFSHHH